MSRVKEVTAGDRVLIYPFGGLGNRVRALLAFAAICEQRGLGLDAVWSSDSLCNGFLDDYFLPLEGVNVLRSDGSLDPGDYVEIHRGCYRPIHIYLKEHLGWELGYDDTGHEIYRRLWEKIRPVEGLRREVLAFAGKEALEDCIGIQVRRTDHSMYLARHKDFSDDNYFFGLVEKHCPDRVFLATDNRETQDLYRKRFGERILVFRSIDGNSSSQEVRKTSLESAVLDVFALSLCKEVYRSHYSSFGQMARYLKASYALRGL
jgi:hypothetical protein